MDAQTGDGAMLVDGPVAAIDGAPPVAVAPARIEPKGPESTTYGILAALCLSHLLNDLIQSLVPAIYPLLKQSFSLDFGQIGLITLTFQLTSSLLQPVVGFYTDKRPSPFSLAIGMTFSLAGIVLLSMAWSYGVLLLAAGRPGRAPGRGCGCARSESRYRARGRPG